MNMMKKNGGFTLVELIVVIAILAILAGVAVPAYSGYLKSANEAADMTVLDAASTAIVAATSVNGVNTDDVTIAVTEKVLTVTHTNATTAGLIQADLAQFMNEASYGSGIALDLDYYDTVTWTDGVLVGSVTE